MKTQKQASGIIYEKPQIKVRKIIVEKGFVASGNGGHLTETPFGND